MLKWLLVSYAFVIAPAMAVADTTTSAHGVDLLLADPPAAPTPMQARPAPTPAPAPAPTPAPAPAPTPAPAPAPTPAPAPPPAQPAR
jgi:hypothetical protein